MNTLKLSLNGLYLLSEEKIYNAKENKSYLLEDVTISQAIDILSENTLHSIKHNLVEVNELISFQRKITYQLFENLDFDLKTRLIFEYESKFKNLILEDTQLVESWLSDAWNWTKDKVSKAGSWVIDKVKDLGSFAIKMGGDLLKCIPGGNCSPFFEDFRTVLFNPASMAIETFLTATGIGHVGVIVCWGILLLWDLYLAFTDYQNFHWLNLIMDILGVGGLELLGKGLRSAGIVGKTAEETIQLGLKNPKTAGIFMKFKTLITSSLSKIMGPVKQAATIMGDKFGIKWVGKALDSLSGRIAKLLESFGVVAKKGTLQQGVKSGIKTGAFAQGLVSAADTKTGQKVTNKILSAVGQNPFDKIIDANKKYTVDYSNVDL
jgi:hypothetical protein